MKKRNFPVVLSMLSLAVVSVLLYVTLGRNRVSDNITTGTVTSVVDKPNRAEDGYYGFTVKDSTDQEYRVNATGYLNTPVAPEDQGQKCVQVPKVAVGDKVSFNLPRDEGQQVDYGICYKQNLKGYYFRFAQ